MMAIKVLFSLHLLTSGPCVLPCVCGSESGQATAACVTKGGKRKNVGAKKEKKRLGKIRRNASRRRKEKKA